MAKKCLRYVGTGNLTCPEHGVSFTAYGKPQEVPGECAAHLEKSYKNMFEDAEPGDPSVLELVTTDQRVDDPDTGDVRYRNPETGHLGLAPVVTGAALEAAITKIAALRRDKATKSATFAEKREG